jgi:hypothetical protein
VSVVESIALELRRSLLKLADRCGFVAWVHAVFIPFEKLHDFGRNRVFQELLPAAQSHFGTCVQLAHFSPFTTELVTS